MGEFSEAPEVNLESAKKATEVRNLGLDARISGADEVKPFGIVNEANAEKAATAAADNEPGTPLTPQQQALKEQFVTGSNARTQTEAKIAQAGSEHTRQAFTRAENQPKTTQ